jgi:shikimate kinase
MDVKHRAVFLIGFMGSGKTTTGKKLAAKLGLQFVDLDAEIVRQSEYNSIAEIEAAKGMDYFREAERNVLQRMDVTGKLVSTGGGAPCYFNNLEWMKSKGIVVYLEMNEKSIYNRLKQTNLEERPLLKGMNDEQLRDFITTKLQERRPFYEQAQVMFNPIKDKLDELVERLEKAMQ